MTATQASVPEALTDERGQTPRPWTVVLIAIGYWIGMTAIIWLNQMLRGVEWRGYMVCNDLPILATGVVASLMLHLLVFRLRRLPFLSLCIAVALAVLATSLLFDLAFKSYAASLGPDPEGKYAISLRTVLIGGFFWAVPLGLGATLDIGFLNHLRARARERRLLAALAAAREAQLQALRYQINPHFLYNTLNSVASLVLDKRNDEAEAMVVRLADFFRTTLQIDPSHDISLDEEIAVQKLYLEIERVRFGERLDIRFDVDAAAAKVRVPALLLQPLVENAIKHGLSGGERIAQVKIAARTGNGELVLEVADNGAGAAASSGLGVGLANVRRRLAARFSEAARLDGGPQPAGGFVARISIPLGAA